MIDERRYPDADLAALRNIAAAVFRLEKSASPADMQAVVGQLVEWLSHPAHDSLRRAFVVWIKRVLLPERLPGVVIPPLFDLTEVKMTLENEVVAWTEQWKQQGWIKGIEEGRQEGLAEGLAAERALLLRLIQRRFGLELKEVFSPLLHQETDLERLATIGEWIIDCESAESLLNRMQMQ